MTETVRRLSVAAMVCWLAPVGWADAAAWNEKVLHSFNGRNGSAPDAGLVADSSGNLYGTTSFGGKFHDGTVFELTPPAQGQDAWKESVILQPGPGGKRSFGPVGTLISDASGNLYGVAGGGKFGFGTVYKLTPPVPGKKAWKQTVLLSFNGTDGSHPSGTLIFDGAGNLYGTTVSGGAYSFGTVYKLAPPRQGRTAWRQTVLISFNQADGSSPQSGVIVDSAGNLYGTTYTGGSSLDGTVFELTPPTHGQKTWAENVLINFSGANGSDPIGGLLSDATGALYGMTYIGGANGYGAVFKVTPPAPGTTDWSETLLHSFTGADGANPQAGLVADSGGNLYGTTDLGGAYQIGVVFKLTPPVPAKKSWKETVLKTFNNLNGEFPTGGLILDTQGNLYGTASGGGKSRDGVVFRLTP